MKGHSKPKVVIICLSFHIASEGIYVLLFRLLQSSSGHNNAQNTTCVQKDYGIRSQDNTGNSCILFWLLVSFEVLIMKKIVKFLWMLIIAISA
jgi:hypothetical protein